MEDSVLFGYQIKYFIHVHVLYIFSHSEAMSREQCVLFKLLSNFIHEKNLTVKHGKTIKQRTSIHPLDFSGKCHFNQL